ncbi:MAG: glutaconate CoA-transferase, partial [Candidatus Rokubacteria bacterium]|nr:glutaconate CoA-transferase [Candidatus Rokubacteria bacterium]
RLVIITMHEKRRFPPTCDYITSPGYLHGPDARQKAGLKVTHPSITVVTDLAVLEIDPATGQLRIARLMPGVQVEQVRENTGFELGVATPLCVVEPPNGEQLRVLREEVDPDGVYLERR